MASPMHDIVNLTGGDLAFLVKTVGGPDNVGRLKRGELQLTLKVVKKILQCDLQFDPSSFIGAGWAPWHGDANGDGLTGKIDQDERSLALKEIDWVRVVFQHFLRDGETIITGEENLKRQKAVGHIRFGGNVFASLWQDYQKNKKNSVLEWLYTTHGITFISFFGLVLRDPDGGRFVLCLCRGGGGWDWSYGWLGGDWGARCVSGVPASDNAQQSVSLT